MTPEEKKLLKKSAKIQLKREADELEKRLKGSNPYDINDPRWIKAYKKEIHNSLKIRQNITDVFTEEEALKFSHLTEVDIEINETLQPHHNFYIQCGYCYDLVPTNARKDLTCSCQAVFISWIDKEYRVPSEYKYRIVKLSGINTEDKNNNNKWWKIWR